MSQQPLDLKSRLRQQQASENNKGDNRMHNANSAKLDSDISDELERVGLKDTRSVVPVNDDLGATDSNNDENFTVVSLFGNGNAMPVKIQAKLVVNIIPEDSGIPAKHSVGKTTYKLSSPLAPRKDNVTDGTSIVGSVREQVVTILDIVKDINSVNTVFIVGDNEDLAPNIDNMMSSYNNVISSLFDQSYPNGEIVLPMDNFTEMPAPESVDDLGDELDEEEETTKVEQSNVIPTSKLFKLDSWVTLDSTQDNELVIRPVFMLNVHMSLMVSSNPKALGLYGYSKSLAKLKRDIIKNKDLGSDDFNLNVCLRTSNLSSSEVLELISNTENATIIDHSYFSNSHDNPKEDTLKIYPTGETPEKAISRVLPYGNNLMMPL